MLLIYMIMELTTRLEQSMSIFYISNSFWKYFRTVGDTLLFNDQYENVFRFNNELVGPIVLR